MKCITFNLPKWLLISLCLSIELGKPANATPSALVQTAEVKQGVLAQTLTVYGSVIPDPELVTSVSSPHIGEIKKLYVGLGQVVSAGQKIMELARTPKLLQDYQQAKANVLFAKENLKHINNLYHNQLATRARLARAKQNLTLASSHLRALIHAGANQKIQILHAPENGVVTKLIVTTGQRVQAGTLLMTIGSLKKLWISLGVEPEDINQIKPGMPVAITPIFGNQSTIQTVIKQVHRLINPQTHLVDVIAALNMGNNAILIPGMWVIGKITLRHRGGLLVPSSSILHNRTGSYVFVIKNHHAHKIRVFPKLQKNGTTLIISTHLRVGNTIVEKGNYELRNQMEVRISRRHHG